jgi:hypothetical protein
MLAVFFNTWLDLMTGGTSNEARFLDEGFMDACVDTQLDALEQKIEEAKRNSYFVVGQALKTIRDDRLWRVR